MVSYFGFASFDDLIVAIVLIFAVVIVAMGWGLYVFLNGKWGRNFWHSAKLQITEMFEMEGSVEPHIIKNFGSMKIITGGDMKGQFIIPRAHSTFKSPDSPLLSISLGRGISHQLNPYVAEYLRKMGGKWPEWSGPAPPKNAKDVMQMYAMYAEWKAGAEDTAELIKEKKDFVNEHINDLEPPQEVVKNPVALKLWIDERTATLQDVYDVSGGGGYKAIVQKLQDPTTPAKVKNGIYEYLNGQIQSEPVELWPTWIAGFQVSLQHVAQFVEPVTGAEFTQTMTLLKEAFTRDSNREIIKIIVIFAGLAMLFVGMGIAYKLVAG